MSQQPKTTGIVRVGKEEKRWIFNPKQNQHKKKKNRKTGQPPRGFEGETQPPAYPPPTQRQRARASSEGAQKYVNCSVAAAAAAPR
uniref:Uncharacterized protein n=1 Tax=Anopheles atroparvus TaxID=41427 RepID=A0AAG5CXM9_ANOAO